MFEDEPVTIEADEQDIERARDALRDYYGTAMTSGMPMAVVDLGKVDSMSDEDVIREAYDKGLIHFSE